jgi:hypothetical protein
MTDIIASAKSPVERPMRFNVGDGFVSIVDGRTAVVTTTQDDGRRGLLRFGDTSEEEWFSWFQLCQPGKWHIVGGDWYVERYESAGTRPSWTTRVHFETVVAIIDDVRKGGRREIVRFLAPPDAAPENIEKLVTRGATRI